MGRHVEAFRRLLGPANVLTQGLEAYNSDFLHSAPGRAQVVIRPKDAFETSLALQYCSEQGLSVVPQGGNTGLSGGNLSHNPTSILLSTSRMTSELHIDSLYPCIISSAGNILESVLTHCKSHNFAYPLDLGAKGSCQIGGNIATNAGGLRLLRYGTLHSNVVGLEVVLGTGEIVSDMGNFRKRNTGWDLKQVFIGSEGTLGVITKAAVLLHPWPHSVQVACFACPSFSHVLHLFSTAKSRLGEVLSAFEYFDGLSHQLVLKHIPGVKDPFSTPFPYYVLIETSGLNEGHDCEKLDGFLEFLCSSGDIEGILAQNDTERAGLWRVRESCALAYTREGRLHAYDFSLSIDSFEYLVTQTRNIIGNTGLVVGLGHLGDSNLHIGVIETHGQVTHSQETRIYELLQTQKGSISAEHGIGTLKKQHLWRSKSQEHIQVMVICRQKRLKKVLDPANILNPDVLLPN